jgi:putative transposase
VSVTSHRSERSTKRGSPHVASEDDWTEAVRREAVIRPLAEAGRRGRVAVEDAARRLGLSIPQIYRLVRDFRSQPVAASMLLCRRGQAKGRRRLDPAIEARIEAALEIVYLRHYGATATRLRFLRATSMPYRRRRSIVDDRATSF